MITDAQQDYLNQHAYVPEHIPSYVTPISQTEPHLFGDFLAYAKKGLVIFIGYPLQAPFGNHGIEEALAEAVGKLKPECVSLIAPAIPPSIPQGPPPSTDHYYRLDLSSPAISQKLRNMLKRARREVSVAKNGRFGPEHEALVEEFLKAHPVDEASRTIFRGISAYLAASKTASIFEARTGEGRLVAFDVADFRPKGYAVYMFNFRSQRRYIPGASDLLLSAVVGQAVEEGKRYVNLGLGINPGVAFFKKKWGGQAFLPYAFRLYRPKKKGFLELLLQNL